MEILLISSRVAMRYRDWIHELSEAERKFAPAELYLAGDQSLLWEGRRVSVVGTRKPSAYGVRRAESLVQILVDQKITVCSGLALGIDTIAHKTALASGGRTIAVLPTPLENISPKQNQRLFEEIVENHLAVSEFGVDALVNKGNYSRRNRTMALLSDATIIIEASESSGTQSQAWEAIRLNRRLFLLESLVREANIKWVQSVMEYGAEVLSKDNVLELLDSIECTQFGVEHGF
jgi:DNA processing protein